MDGWSASVDDVLNMVSKQLFLGPIDYIMLRIRDNFAGVFRNGQFAAM